MNGHKTEGPIDGRCVVSVNNFDGRTAVDNQTKNYGKSWQNPHPP